MLSAIAARKAAQAGLQSSVVTESHAASPPTQEAELIPSVPRPHSKRKSSVQKVTPRKKKPKRSEAPPKPRYFEEKNAFEENADMIPLESDESYDSDSSSQGSPDIMLPPSPPAVKRKWSPSAPLNDSSEEEEIEQRAADMPDPPVSLLQPRVLTTFQPIPDQNVFFLTPDEVTSLNIQCSSSEPATLIALSQTETIALLGTYTFTILKGSISVSGILLHASRRSHRVFAPRSAPVPILEGSASDKSVLGPVPPRLHSSIQSNVTIVLLQELQTGIEGLGRVCKTLDGVFEPSRRVENVVESPLQLSGVHMLTHQTKEIQPFIFPASWEAALSALPLNPTSGAYLVKGPKKSGKSTFARTLLNRLLTRYQKVAFLECDLGQSEFTPGGMVALNVIETSQFGPPFTHPTLPNFSHYIGETTPRSSPSHYLAAIQCLLESYRLDVQIQATDGDLAEDTRISDFVPIIINTMGWTKGLGADLTQKIEDMVEPTDVFEIETPSFETSYPVSRSNNFTTPGHGVKLHVLQPTPTSVLSTNYSAADHRSFAILSYFHCVFPNISPNEIQQVTAMSWNTKLPLCATPPYEVNWESTVEKVILTGAGTEDVVTSEIERVLNGALVGYVTCQPGTLDLDVDMAKPSSVPRLPYVQGSSVPSPSTSTCHGLALIRALSPNSPHMHVLTPLPLSLLASCRVLVKGSLELPIWGMLDFRSDADVAGVEKGKVPYLQWGKGEGIGAERRRVRRNLMRKGQM